MEGAGETTQLLKQVRSGDRVAAEKLLPIIYDELRALAVRYMKHERLDHTLQPTALVHEAYLRLAGSENIEWRGRSEFFALAARQIRRVLVDHARRRNTSKRGGRDGSKITFEEAIHAGGPASGDMVVLDDALAELGNRSQRQARVVELRFFSGMTFEELAETLRVSVTTVKGDWRAARAWLARQMK